MRFFFILGISFLFYSLPPLLTTDLQTLRTTYLIADALLFASLIFQGIIFWTLFLKEHIPKYVVIGFLVLLGGAAWYASYLSPLPIYNGLLINRNLTELAATLQGLVIAIPLLPNGVYFFIRGLKTERPNESIKAIGLGLLYLIVAGQQVYIDIFLQARETLLLTVLNLIAFTIFSVVVLIFSLETNQ